VRLGSLGIQSDSKERRAHRLAFCVVAGCFLSAIPGSLVASAQAPLATVSVQTEQLGARIPEDFVGFSLEVSTAGQGIGAFGGSTSESRARVAEYALGTPEAPNKGFFQFMRNLGPGILRLGGNSQDNTCWNATAAPHPDWCKGELRIGDFRQYSEAARASGWRIILGLNLKQNTSQCALAELTHAVAKEIKPDEILGLELGNEPDLFSRAGSRPGPYSPADHVKDFLAYAEAFRQNSIAKRYALVGPATCCKWRNAQDLGTFIDGVGASKLKLVTVHSYLLTTCGGKQVTIAELLAPELMTRFNKEAESLVASARARKVPIALAETNSASCGGMPGVSDAFAAALWGLDSLFSAAEDGFSGINFHFSYRPGGSSYNPVDTYKAVDARRKQQGYQNVAKPLYYAMYLFRQSASGKHLLSLTTNSAADLRSYATSECASCAVNVVLINKDVSASGRVSVHVSNRTRRAELLFLEAPKLDSLSSEVTYGGVQFDSEGHIPTPHLEQIEPDPNGNYQFNLPNAAAALLVVPSPKQR